MTAPRQRRDRAAMTTITPVPPHNLEAERSVLGAILLTGQQALETIALEERLQPEHFYREQHALVYQAMLALHQRHEPIDTLTVCRPADPARRARAGRRQPRGRRARRLGPRRRPRPLLRPDRPRPRHPPRPAPRLLRDPAAGARRPRQHRRTTRRRQQTRRRPTRPQHRGRIAPHARDPLRPRRRTTPPHHKTPTRRSASRPDTRSSTGRSKGCAPAS